VRNLLLQISAGILGVYLSAKVISGIEFEGPLKIFLLAGIVFGLINFFLKPILNLIIFPIRPLTFGLIGVLTNIGVVWFVFQIIFKDYFKVANLLNLFWATLIIWGLSFLFFLFRYPKRI
jgi:putative membrane protein